jgi:cytochrome c553
VTRVDLALLVVIGLHVFASAGLAADPRMVALGRELAEGDLLDPDHTCSGCHGALGVGRPEKDTPRLAGHPRFYLHKQLKDFAAGTRQSEKMEPVARSLTPEQREAAAAYYGSLVFVPYPPPPEADPAVVQEGGILSAVGADEREIRACEICHADAGVGLAPSFPYLAGQYTYYTARQLRAWKKGIRRNDPLDVMAEIAKRLSEEEIDALALYFARVRPPSGKVSSPIPEEPIPPPPEEPSVPD